MICENVVWQDDNNDNPYVPDYIQEKHNEQTKATIYLEHVKEVGRNKYNQKPEDENKIEN